MGGPSVKLGVVPLSIRYSIALPERLMDVEPRLDPWKTIGL